MVVVIDALAGQHGNIIPKKREKKAVILLREEEEVILYFDFKAY